MRRCVQTLTRPTGRQRPLVGLCYPPQRTTHRFGVGIASAISGRGSRRAERVTTATLFVPPMGPVHEAGDSRTLFSRPCVRTDRTRARALAKIGASGGPADSLRWFETLYSEAAEGKAVVPWADMCPNPHLVRWLDEDPWQPVPESESTPLRALDIGCGLGDNAECLSLEGYAVTAFDVSSSAVQQAQERFPSSTVQYCVGNLLQPDPAWLGAFDLVVECYTIQVLPAGSPVRQAALQQLKEFVAPGGVLLVIARGREDSDPSGDMPWPLTKDEVASVSGEATRSSDFRLLSMDDFMDDEEPPVRRLVATFQRKHQK